MNLRLFWKLCGTLALGTLALFWTLSFLGTETEQQMSFIAQPHQQTLKAWGRTAERLHQSGDQAALAEWLRELQAREETWAAVVTSEVRPLAGSALSEQFQQGFRLGRNVEWKIHLYFEENPIMDMTFADGHTHFLVTLPLRMRPGAYLPGARLMLKVALPLAVLVLLCVVIYRHMMAPLRQLEAATRQFSDGNHGVRVRALMGSRNDELTALADTFDQMAERTGELILTQRRLIAELSHELRTPLTRIDMAVSCMEEGVDRHHFVPRIRSDCEAMRSLVEDTLTLAWLENEKPSLNEDRLDLTDLLDSIVSDLRYEYPDHEIITRFPDQAEVTDSSHRALSQALENILRNACKYTPPGGRVTVSLQRDAEGYCLTMDDDGPGVPECQLERIFKPFFRSGEGQARQPAGHGLGLALARRQVSAIGGWVRAENLAGGGLRMTLWVPRCRPD